MLGECQQAVDHHHGQHSRHVPYGCKVMTNARRMMQLCVKLGDGHFEHLMRHQSSSYERRWGCLSHKWCRTSLDFQCQVWRSAINITRVQGRSYWGGGGGLGTPQVWTSKKYGGFEGFTAKFTQHPPMGGTMQPQWFWKSSAPAPTPRFFNKFRSFTFAKIFIRDIPLCTCRILSVYRVCIHIKGVREKKLKFCLGAF